MPAACAFGQTFSNLGEIVSSSLERSLVAVNLIAQGFTVDVFDGDEVCVWLSPISRRYARCVDD
jgi:hypothetical protein